MFPVESKKPTKSCKPTSGAAQDRNTDAPEPVDVLVDVVISFLEKATAYMQAVANQVFSLLTGAVTESAIDLIPAVRLYSYQTMLHASHPGPDSNWSAETRQGSRKMTKTRR